MLTRNRKNLGLILLSITLLSLANSLAAELFHSKELSLTSQGHLLEAINFNQDLSEKLKIKNKCEYNHYVLSDQDFKEVSYGLGLQAFYSNKNIYLPESLLQRKRDLVISIRHETIHALLDCEFKAPIPVWLDEGLAYYFTNSLNNLKPLPKEQALPLSFFLNSCSHFCITSFCIFHGNSDITMTKSLRN